MKTLTLLRHAKSGWDDPVTRDFDRPLNDKGRKAAVVMGRELRAQGETFDRIMASPARRVVETIAEVAIGYGAPIEPIWDKRLYLASAATLLEVARETPDDCDRLLLIGHNPGLEDFALLLTGTGPPELVSALEEKYPTATMAQLTFDVGRWAEVARGGGTLARFVRPRDLDPTLGPDDH
ncbi:histidine phosphatase family protein [Sphingomonas sp.]|uniref:SixA phosphatase family protein n=1 Tax=Sphingomonas sp. TaxID=28214 RepID=UPI002606C8DA|nr:histidine phosphatase family protein [Sphingomonas sp.]MDF2493663.1 phosphohistidine phosphatase [Sphingomonas sp.]